MHLPIVTLLLATSTTLASGRRHQRDPTASNYHGILNQRSSNSISDSLAAMKDEINLASVNRAQAAIASLKGSSSASSSASSSSSSSSSSNSGDGVTYARLVLSLS